MIYPFKQKEAEFILKLFDLKGYRWLGIVQPFGGFGKASKLRYVYKSNEVSKLHFFSF